jgi:hypothetical protein
MNRLLAGASLGSCMDPSTRCRSCHEVDGSEKYIKVGCIVPILI